MFGFLVGANIVYLIFASGERQSWDTPASHQPIENGNTEKSKDEVENEMNKENEEKSKDEKI